MEMGTSTLAETSTALNGPIPGQPAALPQLDPPVPVLAGESNLIERFQNDVELAGLVGEKKNAAMVFLCAVSARLDEPLNLTVQGSSAAGKNHLIGTVAHFIPPENRKFITGMTPKTLMHAEEDEFQHKAVFIAEYEGVSGADYAIRTMQSERVIEWDFVDTKQGVQKKHNRVNGPAAFIQATTRVTLHPENETRLLFIQIDESPEQTRAIMRQQAQNAATGSPSLKPELYQPWHQFISGLGLTKVQIPFAPQLAEIFSADQVRARRDFPKLLALMETSAYLHQHQRHIQDGAVIANSDDYHIAKDLFEQSYGAGSEKAVRELVKAAREIIKLGDINTGETYFTIAEVMKKLGWRKTKAYEVRDRALEGGYIADGEKWSRYVFVRSVEESPLQLPDRV